MIQISGAYFHLQGKSSSMILHRLDTGHVMILHYGSKMPVRQDYAHLLRFPFFTAGTNADYPGAENLALQNSDLLLPGFGRGDHRRPAIHLEYADGSRTSDFLLKESRIVDGCSQPAGLPGLRNPEAGASAQTLVLEFAEAARDVRAVVSLTLIEEIDIIGSFVRIENGGEPLVIRKLTSLNLDLPHSEYSWMGLEGEWIREKQVQDGPIPRGITTLSSNRLVSSADHNPFAAFIGRSSLGLRGGRGGGFGAGSSADSSFRSVHAAVSGPGSEFAEHHASTIGVALLYSGNHDTSFERSSDDRLRIQTGISSFDFSWALGAGESFSSPQAVLTYSSNGLNGMSRNFHKMFHDHVIAPQWKNVERPLLFNSWEAKYFDFTEQSLMKLVRAGKEMGLELFVLDDGWFKGRNDDSSSLGDWFADEAKLPRGLEGLAKSVRKEGLKFGLWVEPEMISRNSDLYRAHPEWAISLPDREAATGRNQLILDLANPQVIGYLETRLGEIFSAVQPDYIKWDMNRCGTDLYSPVLSREEQAGFSHRYVLGLYRLLDNLTTRFPQILFESCAAGGNRHDAGMIYYMPQTWASDNTDPGVRMRIQHGAGYLFPQHSVGSHVGSDPSHQMLRNNSIEGRFNCAAFGALGYEMDFTKLNNFDRKTIQKQIAWYKEHRKLFQFGRLTRLSSPFTSNYAIWQIMNDEGTEGFIGYFQREQEANPGLERILPAGLQPEQNYVIVSVPHSINIMRFGELINPYIPFNVSSRGIPGIAHKVISDNYIYAGEQSRSEMTGEEFMSYGFPLAPQFNGMGYSSDVRIMGDFGSRLFHIRAVPGDTQT